MNIKDVLQFTKNMIRAAAGVPAQLFDPAEQGWESIDLSLRKMLDPDFDYEAYFGRYTVYMKEKVFYCLSDNFSLYYIFMKCLRGQTIPI